MGSSGGHGKRIVFEEPGKVGIEEFSVRKPHETEVMIETVCTLISPGTETAFLMALPNTSKKFPMYPGYSNAGVVASTGGESSKLKVGDRVVSRSSHATHVTVEETNVYRIPDGLSFEEASFFALGTISLQAVRKAHIEIGESVIVLGQGLVGNLALQLARLSSGMPLIAVDMIDYRLRVSKTCGADYAFNPDREDLIERVMDATEGKGADVVIEATGNPKAISTALQLAGRRGRVILLGSTRGVSEVNFYSLVHRKGVIIIGAHESVRPRYESSHGWWTQRDDSILVLRLLSRGLLRVRELISARMSYREAAKAYDRLMNSKEDTLGIILQWKENF
jgi:2-desacetyl-2-hydroxyethyl bacteriochlorophyllide A dehydrogenase